MEFEFKPYLLKPDTSIYIQHWKGRNAATRTKLGKGVAFLSNWQKNAGKRMIFASVYIGGYREQNGRRSCP